MIRLLPYEKLEQAASILNQICIKNQLSRVFTVRDFFADALNGDITLSILMPADYIYSSRDDGPIYKSQPSLPKGNCFFFAHKSTIFNLSQTESARLNKVIGISNDRVVTTYHSTTSQITISIEDLRIECIQLMRYVNNLDCLIPALVTTPTWKANGHATFPAASTEPLDTMPRTGRAKTEQSATHKIRSRTPSILEAEICQAKKQALNPDDQTSVWTELVKMAGNKVGCLLEMDGKDIKYQSGDDVLFFKKRNLIERMNRATPC